MNTSAPNEAQMKEALAELAKSSVSSLKTVFAAPPAGKSWEEIEAGMAEGKSLGEICGVSGGRMEGAYEEAKAKLGRDDYEGAKDAFATLCLYEQRTPKYWGGLAKACEGLKHYEEAVGCYRMMALATGGTEPLPYIGMGYCHIAAGHRFEAIEPLEIGQIIADNDSPAAELIDKLLSFCRS